MLTLKQTRDLVGASQADLAAAAGIDSNFIAKIEQGIVKGPKHDTVVRVIRGLRKLGMVGITDEQISEFHVPDETEAA